MIETIKAEQKTGREPFLGMPHTLCDYWAWAHSDIASNAERGKLAEYLVRCAVQADSPYRTEWDAFDVLSEEGIKIEVKASSYLQSWRQERFSAIQFDIAPKRWWDAETNTYAQDKSRPADVYVFCLFSCKDAGTANPLDLKQWEFYVLSTRVLDEQAPRQKRIGLNALLRLGANKVTFAELHPAVRACQTAQGRFRPQKPGKL